jgi:hypothetical protein
VTCALQRTGSEFAGMCAIPCSVNALAFDIDGPKAKKACDSPARSVQATLHQVGVGDWLGTMQGRFPEDPTRLELVSSSFWRIGVGFRAYVPSGLAPPEFGSPAKGGVSLPLPRERRGPGLNHDKLGPCLSQICDSLEPGDSVELVIVGLTP